MGFILVLTFLIALGNAVVGWTRFPEHEAPVASTITAIVCLLMLAMRATRKTGASTDGGKRKVSPKVKPGNAKKARKEAVAWAQRVAADPDGYAILDTETTGLGEDDEVIEISIIDPEGRLLYHGRVRPAKRHKIPEEATAIHGIRMEDLAGAPTWPECWEKIAEAVRGRAIITYNAEYDRRIIRQTALRNGGEVVGGGTWDCAMLAWAAWVGEWNDDHGGWRWHRLDGDHSALGDCIATLRRIRKMAGDKREVRWPDLPSAA